MQEFKKKEKENESIKIVREAVRAGRRECSIPSNFLIRNIYFTLILLCIHQNQ